MNLITPRQNITPVISQLDGLECGRQREHWDGRIDTKATRFHVEQNPNIRVRRGAPGLRRCRGDLGTFASGVYYLTLRDILQNDTAVDYLADTIKVALYTDTNTPNFGTDTQYTTTNEISGTGYTAGGAAIANDTITLVSGNLVYDGDDTAWTTATFSSVRGCKIYDDTITTPVADPAIMAVTFGADFSVTAGTFTIQWSASGILVYDLP